MANVTINLVYGELKRVRKELHELRRTLVPQESIEEDERQELRSILAQMQMGKEKNWRTVLGK